MRLTYDAVSHCGLVRPGNEDAILVGNMILRDSADTFSFEIPSDGVIFPALVCDGVGGNSRGEEASMMACGHFKTFVEKLELGLDDDSLIRQIKQTFADCNREIIEASNGCGMATTLTGLLVYGHKAFILNAGDSRTYRLRYGNLKQLTHGHTAEHDGRRIITNCLGLPVVTLDIAISAIVPGDTFLICSDGLFDMLDEATISANITSSQTLLNLALSAGGADNTSLILINIKDRTVTDS